MKKKIISLLLSLAVSVSLPVAGVSAIEYGVDISKYQGEIKWEEFKDSGMSFAILRVGTTRYGIDSRFEEYYNGTRNIGIKTGAYLFDSAYTLKEFKDSAYTFLEYLEGKEWEMPVYIDLEEDYQTSLGKNKLTTYALAAMNIISEAGYTTGIYSNKYWFTNFLDRDLIEKAGYEIWWAQYPGTLVNPLDYDKSDVCGIWQYSSSGTVRGIPYARVDLNIAYKTYNEKKHEVSCRELWLDPLPEVQVMRSGAGNEYGEIIAVPPQTVIKITDKKNVDGVLWGKGHFDGYVGWFRLDNSINISSENDPSVINPVLYDVNNDGIISASDETELRKYILSVSGEGIEADINNDGTVNVFDCQRIKAFLLGETK